MNFDLKCRSVRGGRICDPLCGTLLCWHHKNAENVMLSKAIFKNLLHFLDDKGVKPGIQEPVPSFMLYNTIQINA